MNFSIVVIQDQVVLVAFVTKITLPLGTFFLHMLKSDVPFGIVFPWHFFVAQQAEVFIIV